MTYCKATTPHLRRATIITEEKLVHRLLRIESTVEEKVCFEFKHVQTRKDVSKPTPRHSRRYARKA